MPVDSTGAYDRVVRTLVLSVGIGSLVFTLLGLPQIIDQHSELNPLYSTITIAFFCGLPLVMAAISFRVPVHVLKILATSHVFGTLILLLLWVPAMTVPELLGSPLPWLINTITVATCQAAIALTFLGAWVYMLLIAVVSAVVRYLSYGGGDASIAVQDGVMLVLISGFMMALLQLTLRAGREQDTASLMAQDAAAASAAAETRERQRTRYHAFTHDDVLATLLAASQDGSVPSEITRRSAAVALAKMDQFRDDVPVPESVDLAGLDQHLRETARELGIPLDSTLSLPGTAPLDIPIETCDALNEALTEAMRNSVRHSAWPDGRPVVRTASARRTSTGVRIVVEDDGKGFNPRLVGIDRLGVRLSILRRVNSQQGGTATIRSARGEGTTVTLEWSAVAR